jgi:hypothetical protein
MLINAAFTIGISTMLTVLVYNISIWIVAILNGVLVEKVCACYGPTIYKKTINGTEISLGCIPTGGFTRLSGMIDESTDKNNPEEIKSYDFRGKSAVQRTLILLSSLLVPFIIGVILLSSSTSTPLSNLFSDYLRIAFFQLPLEEGNTIWELLYNNFLFLVGFISILMSISNLASTLHHVNSVNEFTQALKLSLIIALYLFIFALWIVLFRLEYSNFTLLHIPYFIAGAMLVGSLSMIPYIILAKILPSPQ